VQTRSENFREGNKGVEIDENKFGKRQYHTSHSAKGQSVFGETDGESG
jgi:hypothetical protein